MEKDTKILVDTIKKLKERVSALETPNTTITHYCPISESNSINDLIIDAPIYLTGEIFKYDSNQFVNSTADDTTDWICSVKTQDTWKDYAGICVRIDSQKNCITFASILT